MPSAQAGFSVSIFVIYFSQLESSVVTLVTLVSFAAFFVNLNYFGRYGAK